MTPLEEKLRRQIELTGPLSVADYMAQCLFDPEYGYYTTRDPFGSGGDFTTAPEVSQMFGEIIAAWWLAARTAMDLPGMHLAEIGPGRGTLMDDMLRTLFKLAGALPPVHMIEASPRLSAIQASALARHKANIAWHAQLKTLPPAPTGFIANELFDALPLRQFQKTPDGWHERVVQIGVDGALALTLSLSRLDPALLPAGHEQAETGAVFEYAPARLAFMETLAAHLKKHGGFALFIDYGHTGSGLGDTLQAVRAHQYVSVFDRPGESDLTSHVDFGSLSELAEACGLSVTGVLPQGGFLNGAGIQHRATQLAAAASPEAAKSVHSAVNRLTGQDEMGRIFKVMAVSSRSFDAHPLKFRH
jgi:SAM-dependent MidA family methyltransferase